MKSLASPWTAIATVLLGLALLLADATQAQSVFTTIPAGSEPRAVAVNPSTNRIYVANEFSDSVTVIDGATHATTQVAVGKRPQHVGVNASTNKIYVSNAQDATLSIIDGANNTVRTYAIGGSGPILVDESLNRIYVIRLGVADEVTYFDGNTNTWYTIATDSFSPVSIALNPNTRRLYVAHYATGDVRVVDTTSPSDFPPTVSIPIWSKPVAVAVNPSTNRIYAVTEDARGPIAVIDGNSNAPQFLTPSGHAVGGRAVAVNVNTNKIYAGFSNEVIVIDGATNAMTFIPTGPVVAIAVNATANKVYALTSAGSVTVIDGATNGVVNVPVPSNARGISINPVTNRIYVASSGGVTVIEGSGAAGPPPPPPPPPAPSYGANVQGMWWASPAGSESGWGINIAHQGNTIFATWFTYDADGQPFWLVMSNGARNGDNSYTGDLYRMTGPSFAAASFDPALVRSTKVGVGTFSFVDSANGNLTAVVNGTNFFRKIVRHEFSSPVPTCAHNGPSGAQPNYQDLWWKSPPGSEAGWGVYITHQGDVLFVTWFSYGPDGRPMWLVGSNVNRTGNGTYSGTLHRTVGPPFSASPWDRSRVALTAAGNVSFTFSDAANGTMAYTVDGVSQTKPITRHVFSSPPTVCR